MSATALSPAPPATTALRIMPARDADFDAVATLFAELHAFNAALDPRFVLASNWRALLREHFERTHASSGALWLLAWSGDEPVGLLLVEAHHDSPLFQHRRWAELVALYVAPQCRGSDLAQRFVAEARAWAASRGFDRVQLYVTATNDRARRFYRKAGFRPVQEIWRLDVEPVPGAAQPADPSCHESSCGADLLESGHHHLAMEAGRNGAGPHES